jgi:hypothetical protein
MVDAPSNRTFGNCLLGFHCSQKELAASRASACFAPVAARQHGDFSTAYPHVRTEPLGLRKYDIASDAPTAKSGRIGAILAVAQPNRPRAQIEVKGH